MFRLLCQPSNNLHVLYLPLAESAVPADADKSVNNALHWGTCLVQMLRVRRTRATVEDKIGFLQYYGNKQQGYKPDSKKKK